MTYRLFLDDLRDPIDSDCEIARNFKEFKEIITEFGWPNEINFDNDLGYNEPEGIDIAHWVVEQDLDHNVLPNDFKFTVHSANPVAKESIIKLLNQYLEFKGRENH